MPVTHPPIHSNLEELSRVRHLVYGLNPLIGWLCETGREYSSFLEQSGIPESSLDDPGYKISPRQELDFYSCVCKQLNIPELGLIIGPRYHLSSYGMLGLAAMTSATLYQCYQRFFDNIVMTWTYFRFSLEQHNNEGTLTMQPLRDLGDAYSFMIDRDISAAYQIACEALGQPLPLLRLELKESPPGYSQRYEEIYKAPVLFGCGRDALVFESKWLDAPLEKSELATSNVFAKQCAEISAALGKEYQLTEHIRSLVMNLGREPKTLEQIAGQLHTTPRTLQRKLSTEGTTYKELVEQVRVNISIEYLQTSDLSIESIGARVGYADTSSFSHAFKRWTGKTPRNYRSEGGKMGSE